MQRTANNNATRLHFLALGYPSLNSLSGLRSALWLALESCSTSREQLTWRRTTLNAWWDWILRRVFLTAKNWKKVSSKNIQKQVSLRFETLSVVFIMFYRLFTFNSVIETIVCLQFRGVMSSAKFHVQKMAPWHGWLCAVVEFNASVNQKRAELMAALRAESFPALVWAN